MKKMFSGEDTAFPTEDTLVQAEVQTPPSFKLYQASQVHAQSPSQLQHTQNMNNPSPISSETGGLSARGHRTKSDCHLGFHGP